VTWGAVAGGLAALGQPARADESKLDAYGDIDPIRMLDFHALLDIYVQHDFDDPPDNTVSLRAYDVRSDQLGLEALRVTLAHHPGRFGFRIDAGVGDTAEGFQRIDPEQSDHPQLAQALSYIQQAFVTVVAPVGEGIAVDAGKFTTPVGLEENETYQNWNYSWSLLYTLPEPTYHSGLRATYKTQKVTVQALWVNGWDTNFYDGNGMQSFGVALAWRPSDRVEIVVADVAGPERAPQLLTSPTLTFRNALDAYFTYAIDGTLSVAASTDYGYDQRDGGVSWLGVAGYLRARIRPWLAAALRIERLEDDNGYLTGRAQNLWEVTTTVETPRRIGVVSLLGRLEYRHDHSNEPVFETSTAASGDRDTLTASIVVMF
jgi:hypothetical protein